VGGVLIGDVFYSGTDCRAIPEQLRGALVAVGSPELLWDRFYELAGSRTRILLAASSTGRDTCPAGSWVLVRRVGFEHSREEAFGLQHDLCLVGNVECRDRVLEWVINQKKEHRGYGYLPARIDRVNAAVRAGDPALQWRLDPFEVLRREPYWQGCGKFPGLRCRAGATIVSRTNSRVAVLVLQQEGTKGFKQYSSWETHFVLERLDGGTGWWLTERLKGRYTLHPGRGEEARLASDALWDGCCKVVLFDAHAA
jgi:hypothetical protein